MDPLLLSHSHPLTLTPAAAVIAAASPSPSPAPASSSSSAEIRRPAAAAASEQRASPAALTQREEERTNITLVDPTAAAVHSGASGAASSSAARSSDAGVDRTTRPTAAASSPPAAAGSGSAVMGLSSVLSVSSPSAACDAAASANSVAAISVAAPPAHPSPSSEQEGPLPESAPASRFPPGMSARERMAARMAASKQGGFSVAKTAYDNACKAGLGPREAQLAADAAVAHAQTAQTGAKADPALPPPITPMPPSHDDGHSTGPASIAQLPNAVPISLSLSTRSISSMSLSAGSSACTSPAAAAGSPMSPPRPNQAAVTSAASSSTAAHSPSAGSASSAAAPAPAPLLWSRSEAEWALRDEEFMSSMCWGVASAQGERAHMEDEHRIIQHFDKLVRLCAPQKPNATPETEAAAAATSAAAAAPARAPSLRSSASVSHSSSSSSSSSSATLSPPTPVHQSFFGVYDGHGGKEAAEFVRDHLHVNVAKRLASVPAAGAVPTAAGGLTRSFAAAASGVPAPAPLPMDVGEAMKLGTADTESALLRESLHRSSTAGAVVAFAIFSGMQLYVAHAGDSRAVLCRDGRAMDLTQDHKPGLESEQSRVRSLGGYIADGCVNGEIAVSRALGDVNLETRTKMLGLSAEVQLSKFYLADEDEFVIIACDGLWDVMNSANAVAYVRHCLLQHNDIQRAASELVAQALRQHTTDNVSVILVGFLRTLQYPQEEDGETRVIVPRPAAPRGAGGRREPRVHVPPRPARLQLRGHLHSAILNALSVATEPTPKLAPTAAEHEPDDEHAHTHAQPDKQEEHKKEQRSEG